MAELSQSARRFQALLDERGLGFTVVELPDSTRSAADAARAVGCDQSQIVKSLIFRGVDTDTPVRVLASGTHRVDEARIADCIGESIDKPDATFVKKRTGYAIGGVAPIGHREACIVCVDASLADQDILWAAAGTPHAVFRIDRPITDLLDTYRWVTMA